MEQYNTSAKNIEEFWEKTIKREELCIFCTNWRMAR